jgi:molybdate transport system substrate-binding protein
MRLVLLLCLAVLALGRPSSAAEPQPVLVFAAASLTEALTDIGGAFVASGGPEVKFSFAASSALARQIENGAPAALFASADAEWMDYLAARDLILPQSRTQLAANRLVLVAPRMRPFALSLAPGASLGAAIAPGKLAIADPDSVPAGRYAKAALESLGIWDSIGPMTVRGDSVRAALAFVERAEVAAGIVYATDAAASRKVVVVDTFPAEAHPPIVYPMALVRGAATPQTQAFHRFMASEDAKIILRRRGFLVP